MKVSIVICTRNRAASLNQTLKCLSAMPVPEGIAAELIVVDNGSTDPTRDMVNSFCLPGFQVRCIVEPEAGAGVARNTGLEATRGEIIVFTDDDVRPAPGWLKEITEPIVDNRFDVVAGTVCIAPHLLRPWMTKWHLSRLASTQYLDSMAPEAAVGANMSFSRRVLERVPKFDPALGPGRLGGWEETLFSFQLKRAGFRLGMATKAVVEHHFDPARLSRKCFLNDARAYGRCQAYVSWHWEHEDRCCLALRAARRKLELFLKRRFRSREWPEPEGAPDWELLLVASVAFLDYFRALRRQPRAYERYGLRRKSPLGE